MPVYEFGSGQLWSIPTITLAGTAIVTPTPVLFGALQDVSLDISWSSKELFGMKQFPLAVARGSAKITGSAKAARISATLFNQIFGETITPAVETKTAFQEGPSAIPTTPFTITVTNSATWVTDLGVINSATGLPMTRVAEADTPTAGQYKVTAGVYTFCAADNVSGVSVKISYAYTATTAGSGNFTINNQLLGLSPFFKTVLSMSYQGKFLNITLNRCMASKLSLATKLEDFVIPGFDFSAMVDDSDVIGVVSVTEG
jgi:hypothetical protein